MTRVKPAQSAPLGPRGPWALPVSKVRWVTQALVVWKAPQATQVQKAHRASRAQRVPLDPKAIKAKLVLKDLRVLTPPSQVPRVM